MLKTATEQHKMNDQDTTSKRIVGKPFEKGKSGNPGGRPKIASDIRALAREHGPTAFEKLLALLDSEDERIVLQASAEIMNRAYGKPAQAVEGEIRHQAGDTLAALLRQISDATQIYPAEAAADELGGSNV